MAAILQQLAEARRVRYYWTVPAVRASVEKLMRNLHGPDLPQTLLSAFLPDQYAAVRAGRLRPTAHALVQDRIRQVLRPCAQACGA